MSGVLRERRWLRLLPRRFRMRLASSSSLQQIVENAGWLVADKIVRLGVGLVVNIWIARYLGPRDFGRLNYAQAIGTMLVFVSMLGLPDILINDLTRMPLRRARILASAFVLRAVGAVTVIAIALTIIIVMRPGEPIIWLLVGLFTAAQLAQAMDVIDAPYQIAGRVRTIVVIRNASFIVFSAMKIAAMLLHLPVVAFALLYSLELFAVSGLMFLRARRDGLGFASGDAAIAEMKRLLSDTAPLILRIAAINLYLRIDQVMIGRMLGDAQVGLYVAATRLTEPLYLIVTAAMTAFVPRLSQMHHFQNDIYDEQLVKVIRWLTLGAFGFALVTTCVAAPAIRLLYGPRFAPAIPVLMISVWATVFSTMGQTVSAWFINKRLMRFGLYQSIAAAAANVVLCLVLIPWMGITGGAVAAIASQFIAGVGANAVFAQTRPVLRLQLRALGWRGRS